MTRDGPVESELERMRLLLARVGDRVANLPAPDVSLKKGRRMNRPDMDVVVDVDASTAMGIDDIGDIEDVGRQRAQALLGLF